MLTCDWCSIEYDKKESFLLTLDLPYSMEPHIKIINHLCPNCQKRVLETLGLLEVKIKEAMADTPTGLVHSTPASRLG